MNTDFPCARPSVLTGIARILDLGAILSWYSYNLSGGTNEADTKALWSDWRITGEDLFRAAQAYSRERQ